MTEPGAYGALEPVVTGLAYALGDPVDIGDLVGDGVTSEEIEELRRRGQQWCPVAESVDHLLVSAVTAALSNAGVAASDVQRVLVASESMIITGSKPQHEHERARLYSLLAELGLGAAAVTVTTFAGCSSALGLVETASHLVRLGAAENVLVVAADRVLEPRMRVLRPTITVVGDGVAAAVVTATDRTGWRMRWMGRRAFLGVAQHDRVTDFAPALIMLGRSLVDFRRNDLPLIGRTDGVTLLCNSYGLPTQRLFAATLGINEGQLYTRNVSLTGHLGCPDPLVNLADAESDGHAEVLVLANAPADCALGWFTHVVAGEERIPRD